MRVSSRRTLLIAGLAGSAACLGLLGRRSMVRADPDPGEPPSSSRLDALAERRRAFRAAWGAARDASGRARVLARAGEVLERALIDDVLPRWDGTPWGFDGTSRKPREGSIACGYFVTTTLEEAGLGVERAKLAQQPSEDIIRTLVEEPAVLRFSNAPVQDFVEAIAKRGDGLYIVGLDIHVGYLIVDAGEVLFHHASYVGPRRVVRERASSSAPLAGSKYRVVGKLFPNTPLVEAWLRGTPIVTRAGRR